jgi:ATP-binding cassette, subfamily B (MDR/TAP), member 1
MAPDEKFDEDVPDKKPARFFFRNKLRGKTETDEGSGTEAPVSKEVTPVSFARLFRYVRIDGYFYHACIDSICSFATRFELMLNVVGLVAAAGAGAAQVCSCY